MRDNRLLEKLKQGDELAFEEFFKKYRPALFSFIFRKVKDKSVAEEILNKTFFDFFEAVRDFQGKSSLKTFLYSIAKHKVVDYYRKKKLKEVFLSRLPEPAVSGLRVVLDDKLERNELREKIKKAFEILPNDYERILRLKYIEGLKVKQIAQKLRLGFKATESLLFRARQAFIKVFQNL